MTSLAFNSSSAVSSGSIGQNLALILTACSRRRTTTGTKATGDNRQELAVHRTAHDVTQDGTTRADEGARHDEKIVAQHEACGRRRPTRITVEHRNNNRHIRAADRHDHMDAEQQCDDSHDNERCHAGTCRRVNNELVAVPDRAKQKQQVEPVTRRQGQRIAADAARKLAKGNDRTRERDCTDEDAKIRFDVVNGQLNPDVMGKPFRVHEVGEANGHRGHADQAVQYGDQFRHLRHLDAPGSDDTHGATNQERHDQVFNVLRDIAYQRCNERNRHTDDAVPVAAPRGLLVGQSAESENEKNGRDDVRDLDDSFVYLKHHDLTS